MTSRRREDDSRKGVSSRDIESWMSRNTTNCKIKAADITSSYVARRSPLPGRPTYLFIHLNNFTCIIFFYFNLHTRFCVLIGIFDLSHGLVRASSNVGDEENAKVISSHNCFVVTCTYTRREYILQFFFYIHFFQFHYVSTKVKVSMPGHQ